MRKIIFWGFIVLSLMVVSYFLLSMIKTTQEIIHFSYPYHKTVFPADIAAPTFTWEDESKNVESWKLEVSVSSEVILNEIQTNEKQWRPTPNEWQKVLEKAKGKDVTVVITGSEEEVISKGEVSIHISEDKVEAPIFYRAVPLPFKFAREHLKRVRWHLGDISKETKPHVLLDNIPVCANCHSFSSNGQTLAMDVDARDDKGAYAIAALDKNVQLAEDSIIHWSDHQDGKFTYGLLSQISPNGRYVVSTLKDCEIFVDRNDLEYSQLFFPFKGILVIYDKLEKRYFELEGANDTAFVQSNPCWSPDGKFIYYARARARHFEESGIHHGSVAKPEDAARYKVFEKHFLNRDSLVKFDIYKIPFNDGKGGIAEPVPGASNNGYSNYFPKVSPNGKWLVFCRAESFMLLQKDSKLFITSTDGGEARQMTCNTDNMNSWHSWSPNSRWLVFASKAFGPYTQLLLTHVDDEGKDSPPVFLERFSFEKYANNIPEFVNVQYDRDISINPAFLSGNDFLIRTGEIKLKEGDINGAFQAFDKAVRLFPEKSEPYYKRGKVYHEKRQLKQAIADFNKAIKRENVPSYYTSRGIAYLQLKNYDEAKKDLSKALELDPTSYTPWTYLGVAYTDLDENEKAIECLQKSVSLYGEDAYTHYYLGLARYSKGQWDKANQALSKAVRYNPDESIKNLVFMLRARARLQLEDAHGAIQDLTVAIQLSPNDPSLYYLRGRAQLEIGRRDEARANLSKAAQLGSSKARAILKSL